jgi:uncharacterized membrane protein HdeD (DUF308 family)
MMSYLGSGFFHILVGPTIFNTEHAFRIILALGYILVGILYIFFHFFEKKAKGEEYQEPTTNPVK